MTDIPGDNEVNLIRAGCFKLDGVLKIGRLIPYCSSDGCFANGNNREMIL